MYYSWWSAVSLRIQILPFFIDFTCGQIKGLFFFFFFLGNICSFRYQKKSFSEASPDHFPDFIHLNWVTGWCLSQPLAQGMGPLHLAPTKQDLPLELGAESVEPSPDSQSKGREKGGSEVLVERINQQHLWKGVLVGPASYLSIFWMSGLCHHPFGKSGICLYMSTPYAYGHWDPTGSLNKLARQLHLQALSPGSPFHT